MWKRQNTTKNRKIERAHFHTFPNLLVLFYLQHNWLQWKHRCCCFCLCQIIPCLCLHAHTETCTVSLHISTKDLWCEDYHTEATRRFWFHAVGWWLAAAHRQPLYRPNDDVWALRGGDVGCMERWGERGGKDGEQGGIGGRGRAGWGCYLSPLLPSISLN